MALEQVIPLSLIQEAADTLKHSSVIQRTPLVPFNQKCGNKKIYLKLENLQSFNSFKVRGACFALDKLTTEQLAAGVCGASAGNFAQGLGFIAKQFKVSCTMLVPEHTPNTKLAKMMELDVKIHKVAFSNWWKALQTRTFEGMKGEFIHPCDRNVIAGHGTIGLEILQDLPNVNTIICPYGSGGLITGVASAVHQINPEVKVIACETITAAPLHTSLQKGVASSVSNYQSSFIDGMGGREVLPEIWPYVSYLVNKSVPVSVPAVANCIKLLAERNAIVAEGAGAASLTAALTDQVEDGNIVCVISGGNIDSGVLAKILAGITPG